VVGCHGRSEAGGLKMSEVPAAWHLVHSIRGSSGSSGSAVLQVHCVFP
jgi:hypothetical protein